MQFSSLNGTLEGLILKNLKTKNPAGIPAGFFEYKTFAYLTTIIFRVITSSLIVPVKKYTP